MITILIVAVLGILGFVFWRNFVKTPETKSQNTSSETAPQTSQRSLAIESLGIIISYPESEDTYSLSVDSEFGSQLIHSKNAADACNDDGYIGTVFKVAPDEYIEADTKASDYYKQGEFVQVVDKGDYLYIYTSPQAACADTTTEAGMAASAVAYDAYRSFALHFHELTLN